MKYIETVYGSKDSAKAVVIGKDTVYIHKNIKEVTDAEHEGEVYQYEEIQYTLEEYLLLLQEQNINEFNNGYEQALLDLVQLEQEV